MSELSDNEVILHSFRVDDEIHPPVYKCCENCTFSETKIAEFNFGGEVLAVLCRERNLFVNLNDSCNIHDFDEDKLDEEAYDRYQKLLKRRKSEHEQQTDKDIKWFDKL